MSEEDRAAKAARAKALLKKRQQQKAGKPSIAGVGLFTPVSPLAFSAPPSEAPLDEDRSELGEPSVPPRSALSPPPRPTSSASQCPIHSPVTAPPEDDGLNRTRQQTISLLVSEKAALAAQLEHLQGEETRREEAEELLREERERRAFIGSRLQTAEAQLVELTSQLEKSRIREQDSSRRLQEQDRNFQTLRHNHSEISAANSSAQSRIEALEAQVASHTSSASEEVIALQKSLRLAESRADEFELQLTRLRSAHSELKTKHAELSELHSSKEADLDGVRNDLETLRKSHLEKEQELDVLRTDHQSLQASFDNSSAQLAASDAKTAGLQSKVDALTSELEASQGQVTSLRAQLSEMGKRAAESESSASQLRGENSQLKSSLDELRSKVVTLTDEKLALEEKASNLESREHKLLSEVGSLSSQLYSSKEELDHVKKLLHDQRNADRAEAQSLRGELENWKKAWPHSPQELRNRLEEREEELAKLEGLLDHRKEVDGKLKDDVTRLLKILENVGGVEERLRSLEGKLAPEASANGSAI